MTSQDYLKERRCLSLMASATTCWPQRLTRCRPAEHVETGGRAMLTRWVCESVMPRFMLVVASSLVMKVHKVATPSSKLVYNPHSLYGLCRLCTCNEHNPYFLIFFESYHSDSHWVNAGSFGLSGCLWDRNIIAMDGIDKRSHWTLLKCGERIAQ